MSLSIQHNMSAFNAERMYNITVGSKKKSMEKLASGYRINRAADDAASLAISEKMRRQIRGLNQGMENICDGISVCQIMDGALDEVHDIMNRLTELSVKAANGTMSPEDRFYIQNEINELVSEMDRTTETATFNDKQLLRLVEGERRPLPSGTDKTDIMFVIDNTGSMGTPIANVASNLNSFADGLSKYNVRYGVVQYGDISESVEAACSPFTSDTDEAKNRISSISVSGGGDAPESALEAIMDSINNYKSEFRSTATREMILVTDAEYHYKGDGVANSRYTAAEVKEALKKNGISLTVVGNTSFSALYKGPLTDQPLLDINGNFSENLNKLSKMITGRAGGEKYIKSPDDIDIQMGPEVDDIYTIRVYNVSAQTLGMDNMSVLTQNDAYETMDAVKAGMREVSRIRSNIGADQNALEHAYRSNSNAHENTTAAESLIRDTDMAKEMVALSNHNVLEQAGSSMLAQANQSREALLQLLA